MRKLDDNTVLQMLREGKSQRQMADHFSVSKAAASKRATKLNPHPVLSRLIMKHRTGVTEFAGGKYLPEAVMKAHDVKNRQSAVSMNSEIIRKPEITQSFSEWLQFRGLTRDYQIKRLKQLVDNPDPNVSLRALDISFKLDNSYPPQRKVCLDLSAEDIHPVDLSKYRSPQCGKPLSSADNGVVPGQDVIDAEVVEHVGGTQ